MRACVLIRFSWVQLCATLWTVACQAPLFVGFSRQEYWSGLPFPSPEDIPNPGIKPGSPALQADSLPFEPPGKPLFPIQGSTLGPLHWEDGVSATGPPGKSEDIDNF